MRADKTSRIVVADRSGACVTLRPLIWNEREPVLAVFDALSPESRRMRFLTSVPRLSEQMLRLLTAVDHVGHGAWVAEVAGSPVGIARWVRLRDEPAVADIALAVADAHQGRGIGRALLELLGLAARDAGVTALSWTVDAENLRVLRLTSALDGPRQTSSGVVEARTTLPAGGDVNGQAVRRLAAQARAASAARQVGTAA